MTPFERFRSRLDELQGGTALLGCLPDHEDRPWRITFGRFHPYEDDWAVLVAQRGPVEVVQLRVSESPRRPASRASGLGWVTAAPATDDPALPGLAGVLDHLDDARVIRYRPGQRCTLSGVHRGARTFVKLSEDAESFDREARGLWTASLRGELGFSVAEPIGAYPGVQLQGAVAGRPVHGALLSRGAAWLIERIGAALGRLATAALAPSRRDPSDVQIARTERAVEKLIRRVPELAAPGNDLLAELRQAHAALPDTALVPIHGAPHAHQWLLDGDRLGLVDFDRYALGEPELDLATLLVELEFEGQRALEIDALRHAVVRGFESEGPVIDRARLDLYCRHKRIAKATRTAWSLRPDGDARARHHLATLLATPRA